jgi:ribosome maturation factor RimP
LFDLFSADMTVEERVREITERVAASYGLEVVEVELRGGGKARMLRITIDRDPAKARFEAAPADGEAAAPTGVTHGDCERVSREVSTILDVEDVIPGASYTLEVSSPGLDRRLSGARDFERFTGSLVKLMTRDPVNGQRHFEGRLQSFAGGRLTLSVEPPSSKKKQKVAPAHGQIEIELANVDRANLVPEI